MLSGITGVGDVYVSRGETTSDKMVEDYNRLINEIKNCLEKEDYAGFQNAVDALAKLAKTPDTTTPGGPHYLTRTMVENLDFIFFYMKDNGFEPGKTLDPETGLGNLRKLKDYVIPGTKNLKFTELLTNIVGRVEHENLTLEQLAYLKLIKEMLPGLEGDLRDLTKALNLNLKVIEILTEINRLRNRCISDPVKEEVPPMPPVTDPDYNKKVAEREAIILRNSQKGPSIDFTPEDTKKLLELKGDLEQKLKDLEKLGIIPDGKGNLPDRIKQIVDDLDVLFVDVKNFTKDFPADRSQWTEAQKAQYNEAIEKGLGQKETRIWLLDGQDRVGGNAGKYANSLADAATAAQNLNSDQQNKINQAMTLKDNIVKEMGVFLEKLSSITVAFARGIGKSTT